MAIMAQSDAKQLMDKVAAGGPVSVSNMASVKQDVQAELRVEIEGEPDIYALSAVDRARYRYRDDEVHSFIRDPEHPIWRRIEGDSRFRQLQRSYPGARIVSDANGERLHVGEDLVAVALPRALKEAREAAQEEETQAYIARNPLLAAESGMSQPEVDALQQKYRDPQYLAARESEFEAEDRRAIARRAALARAQSEVARRSRYSKTSGMTYNEAEMMYRRQIRSQLTARTGRDPSQKQVDEAYNSFVSQMEADARQGSHDTYERDWKSVVQRARDRSQGLSYAVGETGLGETTREKVRRRKGGN
jgi:hypothetical protein